MKKVICDLRSVSIVSLMVSALVASTQAQETGASWNHEASVSLMAKSGNTEKTDISVKMKSVLTTDNDTTELYASYQYAEATVRVKDPVTGATITESSEKSTDEIIGGASYTRKINGPIGWYIRDEIERDPFEEIDLRNTTGAGMSWVSIERENLKLELTGGLSHRYEKYEDGSTESLFGLDLGLKHSWQFAEWGIANTNIRYMPAFEDFGNYRINHTTDIDIPLGLSNAWKLRVSLNNQYNSHPTGFQEKLDTTYFLSLLLSWK